MFHDGLKPVNTSVLFLMNIKKNIIGGVFWTTVEAAINHGFRLIIELFLARLLIPEDFGIVGMAIVFISFLEVFNDLGMNAALIQKKEEKLTKEHFDTAFWTGLGWGIFLYLSMAFIGSPLVAQFYNQDQLNTIIPVMSLSLLLNPVNLVHKAQLTKAMNFKKLALVNNISNISAGIIALALAYFDFGVWALVFYSVSRVVVSMPLFFSATNWWPKLIWKKDLFREIFDFGAYTTGTSIFNKLRGNIDFLLVGKLVGSAALGYYTFAFTWTNIIRDQLVAIVNKVLYPVYTTLQDDKKKMLDLFLKIVSINNFVVYPLILLLFLFSEHIIPLFFGHKWDQAVPIMKILCIAVLIQMLNNSHTILFRAAGKVRLEFILQIIKSVVFFIPLITLGIYLYDAIGAALGFALATLLGVFTSFYFMNKIFGFRLIQMFHALKVSLLMFVFCLSTTLILKTYLNWWLCLGYYILSVMAIYWIFGKAKIMMAWNIIKRPKAILKKEHD